MSEENAKIVAELEKLSSDWKQVLLTSYSDGNHDAAAIGLIMELRAEALHPEAEDGETPLFGDFTPDDFKEWYDGSEEFRRVIDSGRVLAEKWWVEQGKDAAQGKNNMTSAAWLFGMKNQFNWKDKKELTGEGGGAIRVQVFSDEEGV